MLDACTAAGDLVEALGSLLLLQGEVEGAVVGGDGLDLTVNDSFLQSLAVGLLPDGGRQDELGAVRTGVNTVVKQQILGAGLDIDSLATLTSGANLFQAQLAGQMHHMDGRVHHGSDVANTIDGFSLQIIGLADGVTGRGGDTGVQNFLLQDGDQGTILAVDTADAVDGLQLLQDLHGGNVIDGNAICGVGLVGGDAFFSHGLDLSLGALVPVGDGHMDAVVAGNVLSQILPDFHGVDQGVAILLGSHVHAGGGTAADSAAGAGLKVIGSVTQCIHQVQMGVAVNKAGENDAAVAVNDLVILGNGQICADSSDLVVFHSQVSLKQAFGGDQGAVFQNRHSKSPFSEKPARRIASMGGFQLS